VIILSFKKTFHAIAFIGVCLWKSMHHWIHLGGSTSNFKINEKIQLRVTFLIDLVLYYFRLVNF
ncbi:MAG: hypothetical protein KDD45_15640, partial [Bdellovibrionales bacterium]|nr:hypothetical protein [Bdellovibrionales bacterium]